MKYRVFVVFSFTNEAQMVKFKKSKDMECVAERKIARMAIEDTYDMEEVKELFDFPYDYFLVFELTDSVNEIKAGKNLQDTDAS